MAMVPTFASSFTTLLSFVSAQDSTTSVSDSMDARIVQLEPMEITNIAVAVLFGIAFIAFAALSVFVVNRNYEHLTSFTSLCVASASTAIHNVADIGFWAHTGSSLHLSLVLVLYVGHKSYTRGTLIGRDKRLFDSAFVLFATLVLITTICGGLYASGEIVVGNIDNARQPLARTRLTRLNLAYQRTTGALSLFTVFWVIAAFYAPGISVYAHKSALRAGVQDRITRTMLKVMMPLSTVGVLLGITFMWLPFVLVADLILDSVYSAMSVVLLSMGIRPEYWTSPSKHISIIYFLAVSVNSRFKSMNHKGVGFVKQGARPDGEYIEVGDPPRYE